MYGGLLVPHGEMDDTCSSISVRYWQYLSITPSRINVLAFDMANDWNSVRNFAKGVQWMVDNLVIHIFGAIPDARAQASQGCELSAKHFYRAVPKRTQGRKAGD
jgi:hypothetical protein